LYKDKYIVRRIGYFHDEVEFECDEEIAEEIAKLIETAIEKAGKHLKLFVPLAGEGKVGLNWKEVH
jgi:DNA polymerase I-like protein with 3'-5' exonuclease and polymerase domains